MQPWHTRPLQHITHRGAADFALTHTPNSTPLPSSTHRPAPTARFPRHVTSPLHPSRVIRHASLHPFTTPSLPLLLVSSSHLYHACPISYFFVSFFFCHFPSVLFLSLSHSLFTIQSIPQHLTLTCLETTSRLYSLPLSLLRFPSLSFSLSLRSFLWLDKRPGALPAPGAARRPLGSTPNPHTPHHSRLVSSPLQTLSFASVLFEF